MTLVDLRPESQHFGRKNTMYAGALKPWQFLIPPGVGHGYKVIGEQPAILVYVTNRLYNPKDEGPRRLQRSLHRLRLGAPTQVMKFLVTGGAGFIGSAFIRLLLERSGSFAPVVNLDKLTYAGNLENLATDRE